MPNDYDIGKLKNIKIMETTPNEWVAPLFIEYGVHYDYIPMIYWRVKGTQHTFTIPMQRLDFLSSGNYKEHFERALEVFRDDYLQWSKDNFDIDWKQDYEKQFNKFILL
jgi:hypothetical protein